MSFYFLRKIFVYLTLGIISLGVGQQPQNTLSLAEVEAGFDLLFDGITIDRNLIASSANQASDWTVDNEALKSSDNANDLCTQKQYANFELRIDIKTLNQNQNSGIFTRSTRNGNDAWQTGSPEFAIQGDPHTCNYECHAGDDYDMKAGTPGVHKTGNFWNPTVLFFNENFIEFWINGELVNEYELFTAEWNTNKQNSKWSGQANFAQSKVGYICIQDHGGGQSNNLWFRNYKIREFSQDGKVPSPVIEFTDSSTVGATVNLDIGMTGVEIRYTTDGSNPDQNSDLYSNPFSLQAGSTVKVQAFRNRFNASDVVQKSIANTATGLREMNPNIVFFPSAVSITENGLHNLSVQDIAGNIISNQEKIGPEIYLFSNLSPGIYFVSIGIEGRNLSRKIFIF